MITVFCSINVDLTFCKGANQAVAAARDGRAVVADSLAC